jgi:hypothetical protein
MNITYIANHTPHGNEEEGAIAHALEELGHKVNKVEERVASVSVSGISGDVILFHHFRDTAAIQKMPPIPKVFWCFDLIDFEKEPILLPRFQERKVWARRMLELCDIGFFTDGEWVAKDQTGKAVWLTQGFDSRQQLGVKSEGPKLLFTGTNKHGKTRESFVEEMSSTYGNDFSHIHYGTHGRVLANLYASATIVLAPDGPISDYYWSNRVYLTLGYGGFLLHPVCSGLLFQYTGDRELVYYENRNELHELIRYFLSDSKQAKLRKEAIAHNGRERTLTHHTYHNRVAHLIKIIEDRLRIPNGKRYPRS